MSITAGSVAALAAGCSGTTPPQPAAAPPAACHTSMSEAQALWDPLHDGTGGYGDTPSLTDPPSLYTTAWSLQLAASSHVATPDVDLAVVVPWLSAGAADPSRFTNESELSPLARIQLAVSTLKAIGAAEPNGVPGELEALREGGSYRDSPTSSPDWSATALASLTLADLGAELPAPVVRNAETAASRLTSAFGPQDIDETGVPILLTLAASHPGAGGSTYPADLTALLRSWSNTELATGPSAVTLGDLYDIHLVAQKLKINLPALPPSFLGALRTSDGSYGLTRTAAGDPQITYYAVALGAAFPDKAHAVLALGQARNGWLANESPPTALDTYQAAVTAALCSAPQHPVSSQLLDDWIESALSAAASQTTHSQETSATLAESCWLARDQQAPLPAAALTAEVQALTNQLRADVHSAAAGRDLAAADVCGVKLPAALLALLPNDLAAVTPSTMADAFDLYMAARTLQDSGLLATAQAAAARLRTATSAYRYNAQAQTPDLVSTAQGFMICSPPNVATRTRILSQFATLSGPALAPPSTAQNSTLIVNMESLTAAVILDAGVVDPQYLL